MLIAADAIRGWYLDCNTTLKGLANAIQDSIAFKVK